MVTEKLVPTMAVIYIAATLTVIITNIAYIGDVFRMIFVGAFNADAAIGGAVGITIMTSIKKGVGRGCFSNEAGMGSAPIAHAATNTKEPAEQAMWGIFEVFFDTFVVCTMTAVVVLSTGFVDLTTGMPVAGANGDTLVSQAFGMCFGAPGTWFVAIAMLFFAFTTVLGWSQYGSKAVEYLFGTKGVKVYRVIFVAMILSGAVMEGGLAWDLSDTFNGLMMIPNLIGVVALLPLVLKITKNYVDRKIRGKDVSPILSYDPAIQQEMESASEEI